MNPPPDPVSDNSQPPIGEELEASILFVDLLNSSDFASILELRDFAAFLDEFEELCRRQCEYFFEVFHKGEYRRGKDYSWEISGDELVVFVHTDKPANDVYQLLCLAITLKCGWLASRRNGKRIRAGVPAAELGAGIHVGTLWATPRSHGYRLRGAAISVAKRIETASRTGERFRICLSDAAFKRIGLTAKHVLVSPRHLSSMKGIALPVQVVEVQNAFMDLTERLAPEFASEFRAVGKLAFSSASYDGWIHSCLQVWEERVHQAVTDDCMNLCRKVLLLEPTNVVALYYAAQHSRERNDLETALHYLEDLTSCCPKFAFGWLELARLLKAMGRPEAESQRAILQARRHGITPDEEA